MVRASFRLFFIDMAPENLSNNKYKLLLDISPPHSPILNNLQNLRLVKKIFLEKRFAATLTFLSLKAKSLLDFFKLQMEKQNQEKTLGKTQQ